jgi:hypothetical protein
VECLCCSNTTYLIISLDSDCRNLGDVSHNRWIGIQTAPQILIGFAVFFLYIFGFYFLTLPHIQEEFHPYHTSLKPLIYFILLLTMCLQTSANSDFVNAPMEKVSMRF